MSSQSISRTIEIPEGMKSGFVNSVISQYIALKNLTNSVNITYNSTNICFWGNENGVLSVIGGTREFIQSYFQLLLKWKQLRSSQQQTIRNQLISSGDLPSNQGLEDEYFMEFPLQYLADADPFKGDDLNASFFIEKLLPAFIDDVRSSVRGASISFSELENDQFQIELLAETESECKELHTNWCEASAIYEELLTKLGYKGPTGSSAKTVGKEAGVSREEQDNLAADPTGS